MCCCLSNRGLLTAPERCDVLTPMCICFPKSSASLSNLHLWVSMFPNRFSKAWHNLPLSYDLGKGHLAVLIGARYSWTDLLDCGSIRRTKVTQPLLFCKWCPELAVSWKVVILLLHTSNLNNSCRGGLALIGRNNQYNPAAPCCWELPYPCYMVIFSMRFCRCQAAKAILWVGLFVLSPPQDPTSLLM